MDGLTDHSKTEERIGQECEKNAVLFNHKDLFEFFRNGNTYKIDLKYGYFFSVYKLSASN